MTRLVCFDLETTGIDVDICEVVQVGAIAVDLEGDDSWDGESRAMLCKPSKPIPESATAVHGLTDEDVADAPAFAQVVRGLVDWMGDVMIVTFNGERYDIPIIQRYMNSGVVPRHWQPAKSIDMYRVWEFMRRSDMEPIHSFHTFPASIMSGSLSAMYAWLHGQVFDRAHDALVDCRSTLDSLKSVGTYGLTIADCLEISSNPLPGDVDWSGKLKWDGDDVVFAFGKHRGKPVRGEFGKRGYVDWMLGSDFPVDTCKILRAMQMGRFPKRAES